MTDPFSTSTADRVAVAALLYLKDQRALTFQCACAMYKAIRQGITAPRIHVRAPRRELSQRVKVPSVIAMSSTVRTAIGLRFQLFSPSPERNGSKISARIATGRNDEKKRGFHGWRKKRQQSVKPQEKVIRLGGGLDDRRDPAVLPAQRDRSRGRRRRRQDDKSPRKIDLSRPLTERRARLLFWSAS